MDQSRFDSAQIGGDYYREVANRLLIPRIIERNKQVLNVAPVFFRFYQRAYTGRRCSCFSNNETSPASNCLVCFGTGNTAGYQLYGHQTEVFDATAESSAVNVVIDYDCVARPLAFRLFNGALRGFLDFVLPVRGGLNECSLASLHAVAPRGTRVRAACKLFAEPAFVALSMQAITERLEAAQLSGLLLRVTLERDSITAQSPRFSFLRVRYRTLRDDLIRGDEPRSVEVNRSSEYGFFDEAATKSLFLDNTLRSVTTEDFFRHVNTGRMWRATSVNANAPGDYLTSWDVDIALVQSSERFANIP
jgi:hypothetical protein